MNRIALAALLCLSQEGPRVDGTPFAAERAAAARRDLDRVRAEWKALPDDPASRALLPYRRYFEEYEEALGAAFEETSDLRALADEAARRTLVLIGDLHDSPACRKNTLALLRAVARTKKVVLGLECFTVQCRPALEQFVKGRLAVKELTRGCADHWPYFGLPGALWDDFLESARDAGFRIEPLEDAALDPEELLWSGNTHRRDERAAERIRTLLRNLGDGEVLCVVYGVYHLLGKGHLGDRLPEDRLTVTAYAPAQHLDHAARRGGEAPSVLRLRKGLYYLPCLAGDRLAAAVEGSSVRSARAALESLWLRRKYAQPPKK